MENNKLNEIAELLMEQNEILSRIAKALLRDERPEVKTQESVSAPAEVKIPESVPQEQQDPGTLETYYFRRKSTGAVVAYTQGVHEKQLSLLAPALEKGEVERITREDYEAARNEPAVPLKPEPKKEPENVITRDMVREMLLKLRDSGGKGANKARVAVILQQCGAGNFQDLADSKLAACYEAAKMALEGV